jgi:ligand-binding sensor domain-containing protein
MAMRYSRIAILLLLNWIFLLQGISVLGQEHFSGKNAYQDDSYRFENYSIKDGLKGKRVTDIAEDNDGNIWIATLHGLHKFNGFSFELFGKDQSNSAFWSSEIYCLNKDLDGQIWCGTSKGLTRVNPVTYEVINFDLNTGDTVFDPAWDIRSIYTVNDSLFWIGSHEGKLFLFNRLNFEVLQVQKHQQCSQPYYTYHDVYVDRRGRLWSGGRGIGPLFFDSIQRKFRYPVFKPGYRKRDADITKYYEDSEDNFWICAIDGMYLYDRSVNRMHKFLSVSTFDIVEPDANSMWIGTGAGLFLYNRTKNEFTRFTKNRDNPYSLISNHINCLFEDSFGNLWVGTYGGLSVLKRRDKRAQHYFYVPNSKYSPSSNKISDIHIDSDKNVWIATSDQGLDRMDFESKTFINYRHDPGNPASLGTNRMKRIYEDEKGDLYLALWNGVGFGRYNKKTDDFDLFTFDKEKRSNDWYNDFTQDKDGTLYVGFWGAKGLHTFDREKDKLDRNLMNKFENWYDSRLTTRLFTDSKNRIWNGTTDAGLHVYYPEKDTSDQYDFIGEVQGKIKNLEIFDVKEDKEGGIWVAAGNMYYRAPHDSAFKRILIKDFVKDQEVYEIYPLELDKLVISTNMGAYLYDIEAEELSFVAASGEIEIDETHHSICAFNDHIFLFGGASGLLVYDFSAENVLAPKASVKITGLQTRENNHYIDNLESGQKLKVSYFDNFFTLKLSVDDILNRKDYKLLYILEGLEDEFSLTDFPENGVRYTNVPGGDYVFKAMLIGKSGNVVGEIQTLDIRVVPPFYKRIWFIVSASLFIIIIGYLIVSYRFKQIRVKVRNLELHQKLLRLQMNPHFIFNSLFAIQNYIYENKAREAGEFLSSFARLIRLILDNSRFEYISFSDELETIQLYLDLQKVRFEDKFDYFIEVDPHIEPELLQVPPMLSQPFIENALEHGVKHLDKQGVINIRYKMERDELHFDLTDNGIGLTKSKARNKHKDHESVAIKICSERLQAVNRNKKKKIELIVEPIIENGEEKGTRVSFSIPLSFGTVIEST